jgi:hypothetical protein
MEERRKQSSRNDSDAAIITGLKGVTDLDKDMDLFRELYPIATPMFELFYEYDMVHDMIPEAAKCFDILKDAVLSADNFSKKYLIARYDEYNVGNISSIVLDSDRKNILTIDAMIEEYDLNKEVDGYIKQAMKYGAKPVMIIPIDNRFRKSAERILKTESADEIRSIIKDSYNAGNKVTLESALGDITLESGVSELIIEHATPYYTEFNELVESCITTYEDAFYDAIESVSTIDMLVTEKNEFNAGVIKKKAVIKRAKDKTNRKRVILEMAQAINKLVESKVKFSLATESVSLKTISKIAGQIKTYRKAEKYNTGTVSSGPVTMESIYTNNDTINTDVEIVCRILDAQKYTTTVTHDGSTVTKESYYDDIAAFEDDISIRNSKIQHDTNDKKNTSKHATGSVVIPLSPDTVIPISVHGKHIGYYVIERLGSDDLGSGVATLLGYKPTNAMYASGSAGPMYAGVGMPMGAGDGAGVILKDMTDLPMNGHNEVRRIEILKGMLTRAISERIGNPDIVDDTAFNSIIFSLIKNDYITKREIRITYVPAHMMVYYAHDIDPNTGIGTSIFKQGLFFAHIYIGCLVTNFMIGISKSADREQLNIELGIHGRIEAKVQKAMRSMQTKRASMTAINNVDTIMKTLGQFQRYISLRHNGNPLVELETIPGQQQVDMENSLMEKALHSFINSFYVPPSAVNFLDETEYARSITLQHALFLAKVVMLQLSYQECATKHMRILLRNKYPNQIYSEHNVKKNAKNDITGKEEHSAGELINIKKVFIDLPSPEGLNIASLNDQISNVGTFADSIIDIITPIDIKQEEADVVKNQIRLGLFKRYLRNLPFNEYDKIVEDAVHKVRAEEIKMGHDVGDDMGGGGMSGGGDTGGGGDDFGMGGDDMGMGGDDMGMGDMGMGDDGGGSGDDGGGSGDDGGDMDMG